MDKNRIIRKFTLPDVKEGSVIEYEYKLTSDFLFNLQPWHFQGTLPRIWSQYSVELPQFMDYMMISQGELPFEVNDRKDKLETYSVEIKKDIGMGQTTQERFNITCGVGEFRWAMKDVPGFDEKTFISSPLNYMAGLEFQLAGYREPIQEEKIMTTWGDMATRLLKRDDFGAQLSSIEKYWPAELSVQLKKTGNQRANAKLIYEYVRDTYTCTDNNQLFLQDGFKSLINKKAGGVAEINLLLTAMLRYAGLQADPVILSSRGNAFVNNRYPVANRFNYVISRVVADSAVILLDASKPLLGFGKLHYESYNGSARIVNEEAPELTLQSGMINDLNQTAYTLYPATGNKWNGQIEKIYGDFTSLTIRDRIQHTGENIFLKEWSAEHGNDWLLDSLQFGNLKELDNNLAARCKFNLNLEMGDIVYISPVFGSHLKQNPFKSAYRLYPIEMPYKSGEVYSCSITVPAGYKVEEMPKSVILKMNNSGDAILDYKAEIKNGVIHIWFRLDIKRVYFGAGEYNMLREFYSAVIAKLDEQLVLKKQ